MLRTLTVLLYLLYPSLTYAQFFCKNNGQLIDQNGYPNEQVLYFLSGTGLNVQLRNQGFSYDLFLKEVTDESTLIHFHRIDFDFLNSDTIAEITTSDTFFGKYNYYTFGTPIDGIRDIKTFRKVIYTNIYKQIDIQFLVDGDKGYKYNYILHPGSEPSSICIKISGADVSLTNDGHLLFNTPLEPIEEVIPDSYYEINGERIFINSYFIKKGNGMFGIETDSKIPEGALLVIDPIPERIWGTYYGGNNIDENGICEKDENNNIYLAGDTYSTNNIATAGAFQGTYAGSNDAFLAKFSDSGILIWGTYYGGAYEDNFNSLKIKNGKIVLTGYTRSATNIATPGAFQTTLGSINGDAMLIQFDTSGNRIWGTYYGGEGMDQGNSCFIDNSENIYFTGYTASSIGISTSGSHQSVYGGGTSDVFLSKFSINGIRQWATYYGGNSSENTGRTSCLVDNDFVYICGSTKSANNIATPGSFQPNLNGLGSTWDGFLSSFLADGTRQWGTYFGGADDDIIGSVAVTQNHSLILTGSTTSSGIATPGSFQPIFGGIKDAFLTKFFPSGQNLWTTYYGGPLEDIGNCVETDPYDNIYLAGQTNSISGISTTDAYQENFAGGVFDGMLIKFDSNGSRIWGTYFGGENEDRLWNCSYANNNILYLAGYTFSLTGISTPDSHQPVFGGGIMDNFLEKFNVCPIPDTAGLISGPDTLCIPVSSIIYSITPINNSLSYNWSLPLGANIISGLNTDSIVVDFSSVSISGIVSVYGVNSCGNGDSSFIIVTLVPADSVKILISASQNAICSGTSVTFMATPIKPGTTPFYQWKVNGINQGINDTIFNFYPSDNDTVMCVLTSSDTVCITNNPANSNEIIMNVYPNLPVSISISTIKNPVCEGETGIFTASTINKGNLPVFQWFVNGNPVSTNDSIFEYTPSNGDQVYCILTSSEQCTSNSPAASDTITMIVNPLLPVGISISASANPVCEGLPVLFTGAAINGGSMPSYQWQVNGINTGTHNPDFTYTPVDGDLVTCALTSNAECVTNNPGTSNSITMSVGEAPDVSFPVCFDTITTINAKPFKLKGGVPLGGTYFGPGVDQITGYFNPAMAGVGIKTISYSYTNLFACSNNTSRTISVVNPAPFPCGDSLTDIRDNRKYPTIQIGSQCWLAVNLNHGQQIGSSSAQRDNCLVEKYCYNDLPANCTQYGALYQWDELMHYEDTEEIQGLCPPGWHVPSEADWDQLFAVYQGNAFAGSPLLYTGYSGFNILLAGVEFFNQSHRFADFASIMWSSTFHGPYKAWSHGLNEYNYSVSYYPSYRSNAFSVRCIRE